MCTTKHLYVLCSEVKWPTLIVGHHDVNLAEMKLYPLLVSVEWSKNCCLFKIFVCWSWQFTDTCLFSRMKCQLVQLYTCHLFSESQMWNFYLGRALIFKECPIISENTSVSGDFLFWRHLKSFVVLIQGFVSCNISWSPGFSLENHRSGKVCKLSVIQCSSDLPPWCNILFFGRE